MEQFVEKDGKIYFKGKEGEVELNAKDILTLLNGYVTPTNTLYLWLSFIEQGRKSV